MTTIRKVSAVDLFSYENLDLDLNDLGLVLVEGQNGAGKTTIFKVITWTLFGDPLTRQTGDDVIRINHDNEDPVIGKTFGDVVIESGEDIIEVCRYRKHHTHRDKLILKINGRDITGATNADTQEKIESLLQMDAETFCNSVLFPQAASGFASGTDASQKAILERILCLSRFSEAHERQKKHLEKLNKEAEKLSLELINAEHRRMEYEKQISDLLQKQEEFEVQKALKIKAITKKIELIQQDRPEIDAGLDEQITAASAELEKNSRIIELKDKAEKDLRDLRQQIGTLVGKIKGYKAAIQELPEDPGKPENTKSYYESQILNLNNDLARIAAEIRMLNSRIKECELKKTQRDSTEYCLSCKQLLTEQAKIDMFGEIESQIEIYTGRIHAAESEQAAVGTALQSSKRMLELVIRWEEYQKLATANKLYDSKVIEHSAQLEESLAKAERLESVIVKASGIVSEAIEVQKHIGTLKTEKMRQIEAYRSWEANLANTNRSLQEAQASQCTITDLLLKQKKTLEGVLEKLSVMKHQFEKVDDEIPYVEFWVRGFSRSGAPSLLLEHAIPDLSEKANEYMTDLTDGQALLDFSTQTQLASGEIREKFSVGVYYLEGAKSVKGVSGGELRRADIAIMLALGDMTESRSVAPIKMRLLDEPFENLDAVGKEKVFELLSKKIAPKVGTLLVMSHDNDLKSLFDRRINVQKKQGISKIECLQ